METSDNLEPFGIVSIMDYTAIAASCLLPQGIEIPPPDIVFKIGDIPILTKKSISLITAKAKVGKTTVASWITAEAIKSGKKVLWIDTEQGSYYGSRTQSWILSIIGTGTTESLKFYDLKVHNPNARIEIIKALVRSTWDLIVIDGIRDLVFDINSPEQATIVATDLMCWADSGNCHVITILHQNKSNEQARGHLGTELNNKAETVMKITQNHLSEIIIEPELTRGLPFKSFALKRNESGIPKLIDNWTNTETTKVKKTNTPENTPLETHKEVIKNIFKEHSRLTYKELIKRIQSELKSIEIPFGESKAKDFQKHYINEGLIEIDDTAKGYAKYQSGSISK